MTMLLKLSDQISECLQYAVDARERADAHTSGGLNWRSFSPGSAQAFALAAFLVVIASLMRWGIGLITDDVQGFATYYPAVLFAALVGGAGVGIFASVLGAVISWWAFLPPVFRIFISHVWTSNQLTELSVRLSAYCVGGRPLSQAYEASRR